MLPLSSRRRRVSNDGEYAQRPDTDDACLASNAGSMAVSAAGDHRPEGTEDAQHYNARGAGLRARDFSIP